MSIVKDLLLVILFLIVILNYVLLYKKMLKQRKDFTQTLSHDIRISALAQLRGLELLEKKNPDDMVLNIKDSCTYSIDMINMLLNTYRFEDGEQILNYEFFNFSELVLDSCNSLQNFAKEKNVHFSYNFQSHDCIEADKNFLFKALTILLTVAVFQADKNSKVRCCLNKVNNKYEFSLIYNGKSLTDEECRRMFSNNSRFSTVGHGIKMHLCKKIIEFHGGNITVANVSRRVNYFKFVIPSMKKKQSFRMALYTAFHRLRVN